VRIKSLTDRGRSAKMRLDLGGIFVLCSHSIRFSLYALELISNNPVSASQLRFHP
jgi:hypothetical protein